MNYINELLKVVTCAVSSTNTYVELKITFNPASNKFCAKIVIGKDIVQLRIGKSVRAFICDNEELQTAMEMLDDLCYNYLNA